MAKSSRSQPVFEGSQNSPSPTGRYLPAVPARSPWEHRDQPSRLSQPDPSPLHYRSHLHEMDQRGRSREEVRGWQTSILPTQFHAEPEYAVEWRRPERPLASPFHDRSYLDERTQRGMPHAPLQSLQSSPSFVGQRMEMGTAQPHMSTDLAWRGTSEEMARDSQNSSSPTGRYMNMRPTRFHMNHFDEMSRRGSSDAAVRGFQGSSSPVNRRLPAPQGTPSTNHEDRRFSISSSLQTDGGEDFECKCPKEPPRPRNSFMLYRQHHQSSVAKDNKGSSNPEISKIIGNMWKRLTEHEREIWTQLAEEEKKHHALKYPGYRYKPNRRPKSQGKQNWRCSKCGGRQNKTTRSAESPGSPRSPESVGSSQSSPTSQTPRAQRGPRGPQGYQGPRTPQTPITPFTASSEIPFTTPVSSNGYRNPESHPWPSLSAPNSNVRRNTGNTPSLHRIIEQREPRSPRDYGSASPDRRRRRTNDAGDYCSIGHGFDTGRRPERADLAFHGRPVTPVMSEPATFTRSQSLSTLPPLTDPRQNSLLGDPPRLAPLEPPLPQTLSGTSLGNYSIHRRFEEKP
ncbi:hypothetical protein TrVFT333_008325 [Trichoderma virens FT-333]|nr:hypothetical protein TrVFT333_008325 [Trichoderma virens FT-333]